MIKGCSVIKNEDHLEASSIANTLGLVQRKFKDNQFEVTVLNMTPARLLYIDLQQDENSHKCYYVLKGKCKLLDTEEELLPGDIIVCNQLNQVISVQALDHTELLIVTTFYSSYETIKDSKIKLDGLLTEIQNKDQYTKVHCENVHDLTKKMALRLGYVSERLYAICKAAMYHDIGKIHIRDYVLNKPGSLNIEEYEHIKEHVLNAESFIKGNYNDYVYDIISQHHERLDGTGYPKGLKSDEIMEEAKIIAICDSYDAMTSNRVYQFSKSKEDALLEIKKLSGVKYDSDLVDLFLEIIK
ncbi:MAG: HD domain-containing protein [Clostridia bacterium]|nr:HD domain-containing protein [Clostridia bacterium]